jgi:predicted ATPase
VAAAAGTPTSCAPRPCTASTRTWNRTHPSYGPNLDAELHQQSHGEGFLDVLDRKFGGPGFYLMDEPEAPLSFVSTLGLVSRLDTLRAEGAQVVIATHSPVLTALPGATILELGSHGIRKVTWDELAIVSNWRRFLDSPDAFLRPVLGYPQGAPEVPRGR